MRIDRRGFLKLLGIAGAGAALPALPQIEKAARQHAPFLRDIKEVPNVPELVEFTPDVGDYDLFLGQQIRELIGGLEFLDMRLREVQLSFDNPRFMTPPLLFSNTELEWPTVHPRFIDMGVEFVCSPYEGKRPTIDEHDRSVGRQIREAMQNYLLLNPQIFEGGVQGGAYSMAVVRAKFTGQGFKYVG